MKKILSLLLVLVVVLTACGETPVEGAQKSMDNFVTKAKEDGTHVTLSYDDDESTFNAEFTVGEEALKYEMTYGDYEIAFEIDENGDIKDASYLVDGEDQSDFLEGSTSEELRNELGFDTDDFTSEDALAIESDQDIIDALDTDSDEVTVDGDYYVYSEDDNTIKINKNGKELIYTEDGEDISITLS